MSARRVNRDGEIHQNLNWSNLPELERDLHWRENCLGKHAAVRVPLCTFGLTLNLTCVFSRAVLFHGRLISRSFARPLSDDWRWVVN